MSTIVWNREGVVEDDRWATIEGESAFVSMDEALELAATGGREIGVLVEPADDKKDI